MKISHYPLKIKQNIMGLKKRRNAVIEILSFYTSTSSCTITQTLVQTERESTDRDSAVQLLCQCIISS